MTVLLERLLLLATTTWALRLLLSLICILPTWLIMVNGTTSPAEFLYSVSKAPDSFPFGTTVLFANTWYKMKLFTCNSFALFHAPELKSGTPVVVLPGNKLSLTACMIAALVGTKTV